MVALFGNYIAIILALLLPITSLKFIRLPDSLTTLCFVVSVVLLLLAARVLSNKALVRGGAPIASHARNQKNIILLLIVGGIASSLHILLKYEQLKLRVNLDTPLLISIVVIWLIVAALLVSGVFLLVIQSIRRSRTSTAI